MPTITEIPAITWSYDGDVESGAVFAAAYSARFVKVAANRVWDNALFETIGLYRGEPSPDLIRVRVRADGAEAILITGVVDQKRLAWENGVAGEVSGRDLLAILLDRYPAAAYTAKKGAPALNVITRLAAEAGFGCTFACIGYTLGTDVPILPNRPIAEYISELLTPLRWPERHRVDCWVEGNTLVFAARSAFARGTVTIPYDRVVLNSLTMDVLPQRRDASGGLLTDVRVEGASYEVLVRQNAPSPCPDDEDPWAPKCPEEKQCPYSETKTDVQTEVHNDMTVTVKTTTTETFDECCRLVNRIRQVRTESRRRGPLATGSVFEWTLDTYDSRFLFHDGDSVPVAYRGKVAVEEETVTRSASYFVNASTGQHDPSSRPVKRTKRSWTYHPSGDVAREKVEETEYSLGTGAVLKQNTMWYGYTRTGNQVMRTWETRNVDSAGESVDTFGSTEIGVGDFYTGGQDCPPPVPPVPPCYRRVTCYYSAGPKTADVQFKSDLIGSTADAVAIRNLILDAYAYRRVRVDLRALVDVRIRPGMKLVVSGAPSYWPTAEFYVVAVRAEGDGDGAEYTVDGVAWVV